MSRVRLPRQHDTTSSNVDNALPVTGTGTTANPDVTDVKIESNQSAIDFTFNKTVTPDDASDFFADLSNGTQVAGNNASVIAVSTSSTTVRVTFPNFTHVRRVRDWRFGRRPVAG